MKTVLLVLAAAAVMGAGLFYGYYLPEREATRYIERAATAAEDLRPQYQRLADSVYSGTFEYDLPAEAARGEQLDKILAEIAEARRQLENYERTVGAFTYRPYAVLAPSQAEARVLGGRAGDFVRQSRQRLDNYETAAGRAVEYLNVVDELNLPIARFNEIADFNVYVGNSGEIRQAADEVRTGLERLRSYEVPELEENKLAAIAAYENAAQGLGELADALDTGVDDLIYAAVAKVEAAGTEAENAAGRDFGERFRASRAIRDIFEIESSLDLVAP